MTTERKEVTDTGKGGGAFTLATVALILLMLLFGLAAPGPDVRSSGVT